MNAEERIEHAVSGWTVGQLRTALQGLADELPVVVWVPDEPGDPIVQEMVVIDAGYSAVDVDIGHGVAEPRIRLGINIDWPTGSYPRARRRRPPTLEP